MAFLWLILPLVVLMVGSIGEGPSSRSKQCVKTSREPSAHHSFDQKDFKMNDFENWVLVYENQVNVEDLERHYGGLQTCWKRKVGTLMSTSGNKIALPQIREFYHTLVKANEGTIILRWIGKCSILGKPNCTTLRSSDDGDKTYFDNVQL